MTMLKHASPYLIEQKYDDYAVDKHMLWSELVRRRRLQLDTLACQAYWQGYDFVGLREDRLPDLAEISSRLQAKTGWRTIPVSGFMPAPAFFEMLAARMFPTTTWLRDQESADYTPEPDIFHDVFGHVPMHAHPVFADFLWYYGNICREVSDPEVLEKLGRLFWYTVEFGLIREQGDVKVYGSGIISSEKESTAILDGAVEIRRFDLDEVLATPVKVDEVHKVLFAIESFDEMYEAMQSADLLFAHQDHKQ